MKADKLLPMGVVPVGIQRIIYLEPRPEPHKQDVANWVIRVAESCENISHIIVAAKLYNLFDKRYRDVFINGKIDAALDIVREKTVPYGYGSMKHKDDWGGVSNDDVFPNFM